MTNYLLSLVNIYLLHCLDQFIYINPIETYVIRGQPFQEPEPQLPNQPIVNLITEFLYDTFASFTTNNEPFDLNIPETIISYQAAVHRVWNDLFPLKGNRGVLDTVYLQRNVGSLVLVLLEIFNSSSTKVATAFNPEDINRMSGHEGNLDNTDGPSFQKANQIFYDAFRFDRMSGHGGNLDNTDGPSFQKANQIFYDAFRFDKFGLFRLAIRVVLKIMDFYRLAIPGKKSIESIMFLLIKILTFRLVTYYDLQQAQFERYTLYRHGIMDNLEARFALIALARTSTGLEQNAILAVESLLPAMKDFDLSHISEMHLTASYIHPLMQCLL
ncbi:uncharacterized protein BX664DRAFT_372559 [Halteromyces radiatus]|uniref:uncharacterized protein n=1 Tax=Halteromyces radiatus TaxID=101107 RepID=UPI002220890B|nr:uncharacterized protein BX664DRAFT_372559 [Halteromyces radiatus]KAI8093717.1 hypothetical protein BX664DRAFT_372559 [Halteromyces radiatus]